MCLNGLKSETICSHCGASVSTNRRAIATVETAGRNRTVVQLTLVLANGTSRTVAATRPDPYVAVSDAFRAVRQQLLAAPPGRLVA